MNMGIALTNIFFVVATIKIWSLSNFEFFYNSVVFSIITRWSIKSAGFIYLLVVSLYPSTTSQFSHPPAPCNTILLKKVVLKCSHHKEEMVIMGSDGGDN